MSLKNILLFLFSFLNLSLISEAYLIDNHHQVEFFDGSKYEFLRTTEDLSLEKIQSAEYQEKFRQINHKYVQLDPHFTYWIKFKIKNELPDQKNLLLVVYSHQTDEVDFFVPDFENEYYQRTQGSTFKFSERDYDDKNFVFDIPYSPKEQVYYLKYISSIPVNLSFSVESTKSFLHEHNTRYNLSFFVFGLIFMVILFNLYIFFLIKKPAFLIYVGYALFSIFFVMDMDGFDFQYFWPNNPEYNHYSFQLSNGLMVCFSLLLSIVVLDIKHTSWWLLGLHIVAVVVKVISLFVIDSYLDDMKLDLILLVIPIFAAFFFINNKQQNLSRIYIFGSFVFWVGYTIYTMKLHGLMPNIHLYSIIKYALILQGIVLSKTLMERYHFTLFKIVDEKRSKDVHQQLKKEFDSKLADLSTKVHLLNNQVKELDTELHERKTKYKELKSEFIFQKVKLQELEQQKEDEFFYQ